MMDRRVLRKKRIGVLMGGTSSEREVSLKSGAAVVKALRERRYKVTAIDARGDLCAVLKRAKIDIAFIALHGGHGESGELQGMLEVMGIPYTGSGVLASALSMDKEASKKIFVYHGVPVPPFAVLRRRPAKGETPRMPGKMPWVVKPATEGSSVGVEIVRTQARFRKALEAAFSYGDRVLVERYVKGKEVQIGILNGRVLGGVEVRPSLEFYSYEAKYTAGLTEYVFPPELDRRTYRKAQDTALRAHLALGCSGATRVDLIIEPSGMVYCLEVNTIPGMTATSLLPKIARQAGLDFPDLLEEIIGGIGEG